jgi:Flp pilus assembly protein TadG
MDRVTEMNANQISTQPCSHQQRGAATIEFALMFVVLFVVVYATATYALMFLIQQGLTQAAAEGARAAVRLDQVTFTTPQNYESAVGVVARDAASNALTWLPAKALQAVGNNISTSWASGSKPVITGGKAQTIVTKTLTVKVTYAGYATNPLIPSISFPGLGTLPMPTDLVGQSSIQLQL